MKNLIVYIHGKNGSADESEHYRSVCKNHDVIGFDYVSTTPWQSKDEFPKFFEAVGQNYDTVSIIANSIGAFFAMTSLCNAKIDKAFFVSPIVDMENLIIGMMKMNNVTEKILECESEIEIANGEVLSWKYLCFVRENPIVWNVPTHILHGENDFLTTSENISAFANRIGATLTIMKDGEHWFHTPEQMNFLDRWLEKFCL